jgi:murein DD-endopeptidase MepM/ murein hydrolase activator NlpD
MKDKKSFVNKIGDFLAGKGFYVVLFICTAVIGVSAWILLSAGNGEETGLLNGASDSQEVMVSSDIADALVTDAVEGKSEVSPVPPSAAPKPSPSPTPKPQASAGNNASAAENDDETEAVMAKDPVFVWPLMGDIKVMYSVDELIYNKTMADWRTHDGIDIAGELGAKVMAAADGTVVEVKTDDLLGSTVVIDHGNGLRSIYANLTAAPVVKVGDKVAMGSVIGGVGDTAIGEANEVVHLHFAMTKDDSPVNPIDYLPKR